MNSISEIENKIYNLFVTAIEKYGLVSPDDHIGVCISGGKDSMLLAYLFKRYAEKRTDIKISYIVMDPGYNEKNRKKIEDNARNLDIPIEIRESKVFDSVKNIEKNPCYICARMRRGYLYKFAKDAGCNKIALGHHLDDVVETVVMAMLYSGQYQTMLPMLNSLNFKGMKLIRPLYLVREKLIIQWRDMRGLDFIRCACRFTEQLSQEENTSKRQEVKELIESLEKNNPDVAENILKSMHNVVTEKINGYYFSDEETEAY